MDKKMFCFQCEQTAGCAGCTGAAGACGKKEETAMLQDKLTGYLIGLVRAADGSPSRVSDSTDRIIIEGLFATLTNVSFDNNAISELIERVRAEKKRIIPRCFQCASPCKRNADYNLQNLWNASENIRSLKSLILFGIRGMAAYAYHAAVLGYTDTEINKFFHKALFAIGIDDWKTEELLPLVMEVGEMNLKCMALLDKANTETFGANKRQRYQHLHPWRDAPCARLSSAEKICSSERKLWKRMAKSTKRIC